MLYKLFSLFYLCGLAQKTIAQNTTTHIFKDTTVIPTTVPAFSPSNLIWLTTNPITNPTTNPIVSTTVPAFIPSTTSQITTPRPIEIASTNPKSTTTDRLQIELIDFNSEIVIVWEKCGIEAKTKPTKIFQSTSQEEKLSVWYDPSINSLLFETSNSNAPDKILTLPNGVDTLFFLFHDSQTNENINIYVNCPTRSKIEFEWSSTNKTNLNQIKQFILYKNSIGFNNLKDALATFMCKTTITIMPGTVIHFNDLISITGSTLIFTFTQISESFSLSYSNGSLTLISSNGHTTLIVLTGQININIGIYLTFQINEVHIHSSCPSLSTSLIGVWHTNIFNSRLEIETFKVHQFGSSSSQALLNAFCIMNSLFLNSTWNQIDANCLTIIKDVKEVDDLNKIMYQFLPEPTVIQKIEALNTIINQNYGSIIDIQTKILFASRRNAKNTFFHRTIKEYEQGFTDGQANFWLGLELLHKVTSKHKYGLKIEVENDGRVFEEEYSVFRVGNRSSQYQLNVELPIDKGNYFKFTFTSNCNTQLTPINYKPDSFLNHNGKGFSTFNFGPYASQAAKLFGGFWLNDNKNYYCFSCQSSIQDKDVITMSYNTFGAGLVSSTVTRMYLLL